MANYMTDYQSQLKAILRQIDDLSFVKDPKRQGQIINEIISQIGEHQNVISRDGVSDIASDYIEKINYAKQELDIAKRIPEKSKIHLQLAKESLIQAKDINWQMQED